MMKPETLFKASPKIPHVNLRRQHASIKAELLKAMDQVLERGDFILGEEVQIFEKRFASLCGVRYAVGVNSGTDSLLLALRALGIGSGDEVITVPNSFVATTSSIVLAGAKPVFVDVREDFNMDPTQLESAVTSRTKALLPVHLTGRPADMTPILEIAGKHGLAVIEDAAQAVSAEYRGQRVGSFGALGCFSFHPLKTLNGCGDGGIITTNDESLYEQLKVLRNLGLESRERCAVWSGNSRLDTFQAAILLVKLKYVESWTEGRRRNAEFYQKALANIPAVEVPEVRPYERAVYHTFIIQTERRDELRKYLAERGIGAAIHYPIPIHLQKAARGLGYCEGDFPMTERQAKRILSLPVYPELTQSELESIALNIQEFYVSRVEN